MSATTNKVIEELNNPYHVTLKSKGEEFTISLTDLDISNSGLGEVIKKEFKALERRASLREATKPTSKILN